MSKSNNLFFNATDMPDPKVFGKGRQNKQAISEAIIDDGSDSDGDEGGNTESDELAKLKSLLGSEIKASASDKGGPPRLSTFGQVAEEPETETPADEPAGGPGDGDEPASGDAERRSNIKSLWRQHSIFIVKAVNMGRQAGYGKFFDWTANAARTRARQRELGAIQSRKDDEQRDYLAITKWLDEYEKERSDLKEMVGWSADLQSAMIDLISAELERLGENQRIPTMVIFLMYELLCLAMVGMKRWELEKLPVALPPPAPPAPKAE